MERSDFCEFYAAMVDCPYCGCENELDVGESRYVEGNEVECRHCGKVFELGKSL